MRINDNQARIAGVARYKARPEMPAPAPPAAAHPGPQRLPPALECVGLRTVVAFGRTVSRERMPGSGEAVRHLPEG